MPTAMLDRTKQAAQRGRRPGQGQLHNEATPAPSEMPSNGCPGGHSLHPKHKGANPGARTSVGKARTPQRIAMCQGPGALGGAISCLPRETGGPLGLPLKAEWRGETLEETVYPSRDPKGA